MKNPILSIIVPTFCHESYISQALDSILMQKTNYSFEVLVGDDASWDGTREILKKYERDYPGFFTMYYRETNMKKRGLSNSGDMKKRAKGKYIITLEGDDYWLDDNKLEKEIAFLEKNADYIAVAHNCVVVDALSKPINEQYPECKDEEYSLFHYMRGILPGQFTTVMYRNFYRFPMFNASILEKGLSPGDRLLYFVLITHGKIRCIQETMSAYRHITSGGTSYSANTVFDFNREEHWHFELFKYAKEIGDKKAIKCTKVLYLNLIIAAYRMRKISTKVFIAHTKKIKHLILSSVWCYLHCKLKNKLESR